MDSYAVILNAQRQILAANQVLLDALSQEEPARCLGLRLGETLECIHAQEGADGCGSSRACRRCGALLAVLATQTTGQVSHGECLLSLRREGRWEAREFAVRASPITVSGHVLTLLTLRDISALKRRETLERIFIHDLMNSLQGLKGWAEILHGAGADAASVAGHVLDMAGHLTAEVDAQRRLLLAECGELVPDLRSVTCASVLDDLELALGAEAAARLIRMPIPPEAGCLRTDPAILCRVLCNMVTNALEALPPRGQAKIWFERHPGGLRCVVENPGCMPPEVADRIFQRSFSTKAVRGRGLGTYGMKLLGETVLGGRVGFTTNWTEGTRFFIELPGDD
ncbi:MAG: sensor histidine kinase [Holophagaceae bacterium]